ncbi:hypothetical protein [Dyadobacter sp. CY323]|uniref:hypothetical protein n=1 Tax=Dyadobacter sp. CY323 TaxID=2907302 RepID=UPI001F293BDD|nr:hypothetical protein [Dyadobacter sp. CY323]MCE6987949.1 hypothetical protein [Dyadobacter sp. CY323]
MAEKNVTGAVPENVDGKVINAESDRKLSDIKSAEALYALAKQRLLNVNNWNNLASNLLASFQLTDQNGAPVTGQVLKGNYFKIDIPGPGSVAGEGFDWVLVEEVETFESTDLQSIAIRVRPSANPTSDKQDIAHFYTDDSTSTFTVTREMQKVTAGVYDRNIKVNTDSGQSVDLVRNALVGSVGRLVFSKVQWKVLTDALVGD